jgi:hypothetical protein
MRQLGQRRELDNIQQQFEIDDKLKYDADSEIFDGLFKKHNGDINAAWAEMMATNPAMAFKIRQMDDEARQAQGAELQQHLKNENASATRVAEILDQFEIQEGQDPESIAAMWEQARGQIQRVDPETAEAMPPEFDEDWMTQTVQSTMTNREAAEGRMASLNEVFNGEAYRGYARALGWADNAEEYSATRQGFIGMPNMTMHIIDQFPEFAPQDPEEFAAFMVRVKEAGQDPKDTAAMERAELQADAVADQLEETIRHNKASEDAVRRGEKGAYNNLYGAGTNRSAMFSLGMEKIGEDYPQGSSSPDVDGVSYWDAVTALHKEVAGTTVSGATEGTPQSIAAGNRYVADETAIANEHRPTDDQPQEDHDAFAAEIKQIQDIGEMIRTGTGEVSKPYAGGRNSAWDAMDPEIVANIEAVITREEGVITKANVVAFFEEFGDPGSGGAGQAPGATGGEAPPAVPTQGSPSRGQLLRDGTGGSRGRSNRNPKAGSGWNTIGAGVGRPSR